MATIKVKTTASAVPASLGYGELGIAQNKLYFGSSSSLPIELVSTTSSYGEAFLTWGGQNLVSNYAPIDAAMLPELGANRLAFGNASAITVEYSRDNGATWIDYGLTDGQKIDFFNGNNSSINIGKNIEKLDPTIFQVRVTINTGTYPIYTVLNKFIILVNTSGSSGSWCTIRGRLQSNYEGEIDTWTTFANQISVAGWSGYNVINTSGITTYGNTKASQYGQIQWIFGCTSFNPSYIGLYNGLIISKILGFGGVGWSVPSQLAKSYNLYTYDSSQNVVFPAAMSNNGSHSFRASATSSVTTQIPVFTSDPSSNTRTIYTRTPAQLLSDIGAAASSHNQAILNGTPSTYPSFFAPTTSATTGYLLKAVTGNNAPTWSLLTSSEVTTALGYTPANTSSLASYLLLSGGNTMSGAITSRPGNSIPLFDFEGKNASSSITNNIKFGSATGLGISGATDQYELGFLITTSANPRNFFIKTNAGTARLLTDYVGAIQFQSSVTNAAPFTVASTTLVTNLNANYLSGASLTTTFSTTSDILVPSSKSIYTWVTGLGYTTSSGVTSVSLAGGTNNGTLKLTVNGSTTDNIAVTGLGSAAYQASTSFATTAHVQSVTLGGTGLTSISTNQLLFGSASNVISALAAPTTSGLILRYSSGTTPNIFWGADNNTEYNAGTGLTLSSSTFSLTAPVAASNVFYLTGFDSTNAASPLKISPSLYSTSTGHLRFNGGSSSGDIDIYDNGQYSTYAIRFQGYNNSASLWHFDDGVNLNGLFTDSNFLSSEETAEVGLSNNLWNKMWSHGFYVDTDAFNTGYGLSGSSTSLTLTGSGLNALKFLENDMANTYEIYHSGNLSLNATAQSGGVTFYAPTTGGTSGRFLLSGGAGAPTWSTTAPGAAAYYGITDSTSNSALSTGTSLTTERDVYYGLVTVNGASQTRATSIYAPITAGTAGWILRGNGSGAPTWQVPTPVGTAITASVTLAIGHAFNCYTCSIASGSTITITIPLNVFAIGTQIDFIRIGVGDVAFTPAASVTLYSDGGTTKRKINAQYQAASLYQATSNVWYLIGALKT